MRLGCSVIKLMINDITSVWQTGNHGDTALNKHCAPTGTHREREGKRQGERVQERWIRWGRKKGEE